jgi:hypothetical protein
MTARLQRLQNLAAVSQHNFDGCLTVRLLNADRWLMLRPRPLQQPRQLVPLLTFLLPLLLLLMMMMLLLLLLTSDQQSRAWPAPTRGTNARKPLASCDEKQEALESGQHQNLNVNHPKELFHQSSQSVRFLMWMGHRPSNSKSKPRSATRRTLAKPLLLVEHPQDSHQIPKQCVSAHEQVKE